MRSHVRRVVLVAYPGVQLLDVVGPAEVFNGASRTVKSSLYDLTIATPDGRAVAGESGLRLEADARLSDVDGQIDTLLVAGGWSYKEAMRSGELLAQINRLAPNARRVGSVCSGAFVLAQAGLLDGRAATTHWAVCQRLQSQFPAVRVEPDRIFSPLRGLLDEIVADPAADHTVPRLAERAALSERHLTRLFVAETGTTPGRFVERSRVEAARDVLESGTTPVEAVARRVGFGSAETMRRAFLRVLGIGPADYRARFSGTHLAKVTV